MNPNHPRFKRQKEEFSLLLEDPAFKDNLSEKMTEVVKEEFSRLQMIDNPADYQNELRNYFAAQLLTSGIISMDTLDKTKADILDLELDRIAKFCWKVADTMIQTQGV